MMYRRNYRPGRLHSDNNKRSPSTSQTIKKGILYTKTSPATIPPFLYSIINCGVAVPFSWSVANKPADPFQHPGPFPGARQTNSLSRVEGALWKTSPFIMQIEFATQQGITLRSPRVNSNSISTMQVDSF